MSERDLTTRRFQAGNCFGVSSRFQPKRSGNPRGRPSRVGVYLARYRERGCGEAELSRIANDTKQSHNARLAAAILLSNMIQPFPIPGADPEHAHKLYLRYYRKRHHELVMMLADVNEHPDRREAARLRLEPSRGYR